MKILILFLLSFNLWSQTAGNALNIQQEYDENQKVDAETIKQYPELKKFLFQEPQSPFYMGLGVAPVGLLGSKFYFSVSLFQFHYVTDFWDIEIFNASLAKAFSNNEFGDSTNFSVRFAPKINLFSFFDTGMVSFGILAGVELVQFDKVDVVIKKEVPNGSGGTKFVTTNNAVKLTTIDMVYGGVLSQTFKLKSGKTLKVSEIYYIQNYDISKTRFDWIYDYSNNAVNDPANIQELEKDSVFMVEFSYLF